LTPNLRGRRGGRGGDGITEHTEESECTERGLGDLRGFSEVSGSVDAQIDGLVYELYGLTEEEIAVMEGQS
jgi:hypothetical protein